MAGTSNATAVRLEYFPEALRIFTGDVPTTRPVDSAPACASNRFAYRSGISNLSMPLTLFLLPEIARLLPSEHPFRAYRYWY